jgi:serine/threonine protein kinase
MSLSVGSTIGSYEIVASLGAGGMGEVYRARDTKLNRSVAIKVLPDLFATDAERLARLTREAQVLASLNHPNIAAIYGVERGPAGASQALVMELVDGQDLSALLARGPMALADAVPIARQIADALEAAHEQGVIHRDLKPANIKVRPDGTVKVLDFGLAKAAAPGSDTHGPHGTAPSLANSPTLTAAGFAQGHGGPGTQMGMILGTAGYMSPEQARGRAVDRRADIWAFGVVLYEMLTGRRAFEGDDTSNTLASVLKDDPKWQALPATLPPSIVRLLRRCLEKDPKRRLSAIGDARLELDDREPLAAPAPAPPARASLMSRLLLAGAILITASLGAALWFQAGSSSSSVTSGAIRLSILPPPGEQVYPDSMGVAVSPDGTSIAYIVGGVTRSATQLWVRSLDSLKARRIESADGAVLLFWSPDSTRIGFITTDKLKVVAASGGRAETLADAASGRGGTWSQANVIVFAPNATGPLSRVSPDGGGRPEPVTTLDASRKEVGHRMPWFLPDGEHFLYGALPGKDGKYDVFVGSIRDDSKVLVGAFDATPVYAEPGWLLYGRQGVLTAVPFDARALKVTGDAVRLEDEPSSILSPTMSWTAGHSLHAASDTLAYYSAPSLNNILTRYDANGVPTGTIKMPPGHWEAIAVSSDGSRGAIVKSVSPSESSLWLVDLARGAVSPFSTLPGRNDDPVWSPDGKHVVWASDRTGAQEFVVKDVDAAAPERVLYSSPNLFKNPVDWSADGRWIVMTQLDPNTAQDVYLLDASGTKPPQLVASGAMRDRAGQISPDSRWVLYAGEESGRFELYAQTIPTPGRRVAISQEGGVLGWWSKEGRQVVFADDEMRSLWRVDVAPAKDTLIVGRPKKFAPLPADLEFLTALPGLKGFIGIAPERIGIGSMTVVRNWRAGLR